MKFPPDYPEILADIAERFAGLLIEQGLERPRAEKLGLAAAEHLRAHWGGQMIYIPKGASFEAARRQEEIFTRFNGTNGAALAREFHVSEVLIYNVVRRMRARNCSPKEKT